MDSSPVALIADAHGRTFRAVSVTLGRDFVGLTVATRSARRMGRISKQCARQLERLDTAFAYLRHCNPANVNALLDTLRGQLTACDEDMHMGNTDDCDGEMQNERPKARRTHEPASIPTPPIIECFMSAIPILDTASSVEMVTVYTSGTDP